jgi:pilus assembly protein Flp/PilA
MYTDIVNYLQARFSTNERGAALVEYALLLALIAVVCIAALTALGGQASSKFEDVGNSISAAGN